ncbi:ClpXP protease specificity-enhancing factor [Rhodanobacter denitrificans]|uniref:ClpXP protease specificity-enhancing factor n=2 Tax=Rhodanobacter denitrificans TaxID=666685 RepID=A0A368KHH4_9GAMM|nr:ClpXP protease specificity-enhancing factor [Rhodanobacter denitrificans]
MSKNEVAPMSSNRPYLLRAIYDWISDNDLTPYVLVDAGFAGVKVPPQVVKNGQVVLNLATRAVANLDLGNEWISFQARFSGVSQAIQIPVRAVLALYAQENGQGMMFPAEEEGGDTPPSAPEPDDTPPAADDAGSDKPKRSAPHLRVVK